MNQIMLQKKMLAKFLPKLNWGQHHCLVAPAHCHPQGDVGPTPQHHCCQHKGADHYMPVSTCGGWIDCFRQGEHQTKWELGPLPLLLVPNVISGISLLCPSALSRILWLKGIKGNCSSKNNFLKSLINTLCHSGVTFFAPEGSPANIMLKKSMSCS